MLRKFLWCSRLGRHPRRAWSLVRAVSSFVQGSNSIAVRWNEAPGGPTTEYHYVWLRDNCQCTECYETGNNQRWTDPLKLRSDIQPVSISNSSSDLSLSIGWPDGHQSQFTAEWLKMNAYDGSIETGHDKRVPFTRDMRCDPIVWGKEVASNPPRVRFQSIIEDDEKFLEWNSFMEKYGFCFIEETPLDRGSTDKLIDRIGVARNTLWGGVYEIGLGQSSSPQSRATADPVYYSKGVNLAPHTDGTYMLNELPALQLFQPISFTGKDWPLTILIDGFKLAEMVRNQSEYHYQMLAHVPLPFIYEDDDRKQYTSHRILVSEQFTGKLLRVQYSNAKRMVMNSYCQHKLKEFDSKATMLDLYDALYIFNEAMYSDDVSYKFPIKLGTSMFTDNHRVLHARMAYEGRRVLRGCWMNVEDWRGKLMALKDKLAKAKDVVE